MNYIREVLDWCKSNLIAVVCLAVAVLALGSFFWPTYSKASAFRDEVSKRSSEVTTIDGLVTTIEPPQVKPGDRPDTERAVITRRAIETLEQKYQEIQEQGSGVYTLAWQYNKGAVEDILGYERQPMMADLFPEPRGRDMGFFAQREYVKWFQSLYHDHLHAGPPPTAEEQDDLIARIEQRFHSQFGAIGGGRGGTGTSYTGEQQNLLNGRKAEGLQKLYRDRAARLGIYAPPIDFASVVEGDRERDLKKGPFDIGDWIIATEEPQPPQLWEAQMKLWVQEDLVAAIVKANNLRDPGATLLTGPIKRIVAIEVRPPESAMPAAQESSGGGRSPGGFSGGRGGAAEPRSPLSDSEYEQAMREAATDFTVSTTGRKTNPLYDVRHAWLTLVVDYNRLPEVFNAITTTNFMSIVEMQMQSVDAYQDFVDGYFYGADIDVVEVELKVETIWFRHWTAGHNSQDLAEKWGEAFFAGWVPDAVRWRTLHLPTRADASDRNNQRLWESQLQAMTTGGQQPGRGGRQPSPFGTTPPRR